jgi:hypothetical protein
VYSCLAAGVKKAATCFTKTLVQSSWKVKAHGDVREEKWRGNKRIQWVTSKRHMTAEHRLARAVQTLQADVHSSPDSSRLNWRPRLFKWTRPFRWKTKSGFCACAIKFRKQSTTRQHTADDNIMDTAMKTWNLHLFEHFFLRFIGSLSQKYHVTKKKYLKTRNVVGKFAVANVESFRLRGKKNFHHNAKKKLLCVSAVGYSVHRKSVNFQWRRIDPSVYNQTSIKKLEGKSFITCKLST